MDEGFANPVKTGGHFPKQDLSHWVGEVSLYPSVTDTQWDAGAIHQGHDSVLDSFFKVFQGKTSALLESWPTPHTSIKFYCFEVTA